jgi:putative transposase
MKLVAQVKLQTSPSQAGALKDTLRQANNVCNQISDYAWEHQVFGQWALHRALYYRLRAESGLSAQVVVRCIAKVADAYKVARQAHKDRLQRVKSSNARKLAQGREPKPLPEMKQVRFSDYGAIAFDDRILKWYVRDRRVSIWTVEGRMSVPFLCGERQARLLESQQGESDLCLVGGEFYLFATCNVEEPDPADVEGFLGVDLGIVNIATTSDGEVFASGQLNGLRHRHRRLRKKLQAKGTKSAKRLLRKRHRKEARFAKWVNHNVSKRIVAEAQGTARGIALEDLKGIRERVTARKPQRATLHSWAFQQLGSFIEYKARLAGVPVVYVDPRYTSQTCPECGTIDRSNRTSQAVFSCVSCGFAGLADHIAAVCIGRRAEVTPPYVSAVAA